MERYNKNIVSNQRNNNFNTDMSNQNLNIDKNNLNNNINNYNLQNNNNDSGAFSVKASIFHDFNISKKEQEFSHSEGIYSFAKDLEKSYHSSNNSGINYYSLSQNNNQRQFQNRNPNNIGMGNNNLNYNYSEGGYYNNQNINNQNKQNYYNTIPPKNDNNLGDIQRRFNDDKMEIQNDNNQIKSQPINIKEIPNPIYYYMISQRNINNNQNSQYINQQNNNNQCLNHQHNYNLIQKSHDINNEIKQEIKNDENAGTSSNEFDKDLDLLNGNAEEYSTIILRKQKSNNKDKAKENELNNNQIDEKSKIIVPSITNIIRKDFNLDANKDSPQNKKEENKISEKNDANNMVQNDINKESIIKNFSFMNLEDVKTSIIEDKANIIQAPGSIQLIENNNGKSVSNSDDSAKQKISENYNKFKEEEKKNNIINGNDNSNNNQYLENNNGSNRVDGKSFINVPGLSQIVMKNLNTNENEKNVKEDEEIGKSIVFVSKIPDLEGKENNTNNNDFLSNENNKENNDIKKDNDKKNNNENNNIIKDDNKINNNDNKSIIAVPGLSQIIIKDYNLDNNNNINDQKDNKDINPIMLSNNDMSLFNDDNNNNKIQLKNYKKSEDKEKGQRLINSENDINPNINNGQNQKKQNLKNSFCLLKADSSDTDSFKLLKDDSEDFIALPTNIHNHPLKICPLSQECCSLCLTKKVCLNGNKCDNCPLIICEDCTRLINNNNVNQKHEHSLTILYKQLPLCNLCGGTNVNQTLTFLCDKCNFEICQKCYFSK